jgi:hypothetical protein
VGPVHWEADAGVFEDVTTEGGTAARFEYRAWAERLDAVGDLLESLSVCHEVTETAETYLVSTATADVNVKVRADLLDIKVLVAVRDGFEQWTVHRKAEFPVDAAMVRDDLFPLLGLVPPDLQRDEYSLSQLIDDVVAAHPDLGAVNVTKWRRRYTVDDCAAEIADVSIADHQLQTAAVESTDLRAVREAYRMLGLDRYDNISYPRAVRRALGGRFG